MKNKEIIIKDWAGNILFEGDYDDHKEVDKVLDANRCTACVNRKTNDKAFPVCDDTGYFGDFGIYWVDDENEGEVYDYVNY